MKWINVKDELPPHEQEVLFINGKGEISLGTRMPYEELSDEWATDTSIYFNDEKYLIITTCKFWMKLPNPPNE